MIKTIASLALLSERDPVGVISADGLRVVDAGSLKRARELEAVGFLQLALTAGEKIS